MRKFWVVCLGLLIAILGCSSNHTAPQTPQKQSQATKADVVKPAAKDVALYRDINWFDFNDVAFIRAKSRNQFMILYFYEYGCTYCENMSATTFADPDVITILNTNFVPIKLLGSDNENAVNVLLEQPLFPSTVVLSPSGLHIITIYGYLNTQEYLTVLTTIIDASS